MNKPEPMALWEPTVVLLQILEDVLLEHGHKVAEPCAMGDLARLEELLGGKLSPAWKAFLLRHDGADLADARVLSVAEVLEEQDRAPEGLVAFFRLADGTFYYLDRESSEDPADDWAVVGVEGGHTEPAGSTCLRFLLAFLADSAAARTVVDPTLADHWLDWIAERNESGDTEGAWEVVRRAIGSARPVGPALLVALGEAFVRRGKAESAVVNFDLALSTESFSVHDEEARYDAAAELLALTASSDDAARTRCQEVLGDNRLATAAIWRDECVSALGRGQHEWAVHAGRVVLALAENDADVPRLIEANPMVREAAQLAWQARQLIHQDEGKLEEATRLLERAHSRATLGVVLLQHARWLMHQDPRQAIEIARRAVNTNAALVEATFQMGEGMLLLNDNGAAEKALRQVVEYDPAYGLAWSKLGLALLNQGRAEEALDCVQRGIGRSDEPFFSQSVLGDCLFELGRYDEAAQAYEEALKYYHHDHWTLHQCANAYVEIGNYPRAAELYDHASENNPDGCHQTLADYADLKRRMGRVGDAVRLYRQAIKMAPEEAVYRDLLKEVQKELREAPN